MKFIRFYQDCFFWQVKGTSIFWKTCMKTMVSIIDTRMFTRLKKTWRYLERMELLFGGNNRCKHEGQSELKWDFFLECFSKARMHQKLVQQIHILLEFSPQPKDHTMVVTNLWSTLKLLKLILIHSKVSSSMKVLTTWLY